jgi:hypothetical protein
MSFTKNKGWRLHKEKKFLEKINHLKFGFILILLYLIHYGKILPHFFKLFSLIKFIKIFLKLSNYNFF